MLKTAAAWSRVFAIASWFLTLSTIARSAGKIGQITRLRDEFGSYPTKDHWQARDNRILKKMLHMDGAKFKARMPQIDNQVFKGSVERKIADTLHAKRVQFAAHSLNFMATALIYTGIGSPAGYIFLGGYFAATVYDMVAGKYSDYKFQHAIGLCAAPAQGTVAKVVHVGKWLLKMA